MANVKISKRVRVSKNRKKAWRKHCNIQDVEDFLDDQRLEERTGGPVSEKANEELFFLDTSTDNKKATKVKALRCHQSLGAYSQVAPPVIIQKRPLGKKKKKLLAIVEERKLRKNTAKTVQERKLESSSAQFHDLWGEEKKENDPEIKDLIDYRDEITKKRPVKVPCHLYQKPSLLPAVEVPDPGASYNPSYLEHQKLLSKAVQIEQKKLKVELHLKRVLNDMFPTKADAPTKETWMAEMSQGLFDSASKDDIDHNPDLLANPPVTDEYRKSRSKRRKQKELEEKKRLQALVKQRKKIMNDVYRIKSIKAEIKQAEKVTAERVAKREQREIEKMFKPHTLSRYKYEPNDVEVNLSEELAESMRVLKAEGNLFEDRYKSLQRRNIIEPRIKQKRKRKYKLKIQVKRSHRDFQ